MKEIEIKCEDEDAIWEEGSFEYLKLDSDYVIRSLIGGTVESCIWRFTWGWH